MNIGNMSVEFREMVLESISSRNDLLAKQMQSRPLTCFSWCKHKLHQVNKFDIQRESRFVFLHKKSCIYKLLLQGQSGALSIFYNAFWNFHYKTECTRRSISVTITSELRHSSHGRSVRSCRVRRWWHKLRQRKKFDVQTESRPVSLHKKLSMYS